MKIAFQGEAGAYSEMALYKFNPNAQAIGFELSEQVCDAVLNEEASLGILPVENSIVGNVDVNTDLLYTHDFFVINEVFFPIEHKLLAPIGSKLEEIQLVSSHPVALAQCRAFLNKHKIIPIPEYDTAGSAKKLYNIPRGEKAAIASSLAAEYYGLDILAEDIQKTKNNITRFFVFVKKDKIPWDIKEEKTSLAFEAHDHPGALLECLQVFKDFGINLTKLESRPIPENPFAYTFFVDFIGGPREKKVEECLQELKKHSSKIKIIGSYPLGEQEFL